MEEGAAVGQHQGVQLVALGAALLLVRGGEGGCKGHEGSDGRDQVAAWGMRRCGLAAMQGARLVCAHDDDVRVSKLRGSVPPLQAAVCEAATVAFAVGLHQRRHAESHGGPDDAPQQGRTSMPVQATPQTAGEAEEGGDSGVLLVNKGARVDPAALMTTVHGPDRSAEKADRLIVYAAWALGGTRRLGVRAAAAAVALGLNGLTPALRGHVPPPTIQFMQP